MVDSQKTLKVGGWGGGGGGCRGVGVVWCVCVCVWGGGGGGEVWGDFCDLIICEKIVFSVPTSFPLSVVGQFGSR